MLETILPLLGVALCALAIAQLALWTAHSLSRFAFNRRQFQISLEALRNEIDTVAVSNVANQDQPGRWRGFRSFYVDRLKPETETTTTVFLKPVDGKSIPNFKPGQHIAIRLNVTGQPKPIVRCYSLSGQSTAPEYRISVKKSLSPAQGSDLKPGVASTYINEQLQVGDRVELKPPAGEFCLDESTQSPVVMLAGGIGITPIFSMLQHLAATQPERNAILFYGSRNGVDHVFKNELAELASRHPNIYVFNFYSQPSPDEVEGEHYHVKGQITPQLIRQILPHKAFQFYLCGPPQFMKSIHLGLEDWGVLQDEIHSEAFGPASIGNRQPSSMEAVVSGTGSQVRFVKSNVSALWDGGADSILELIEKQDIAIDSGCRAGSCGTCETPILSGEVRYPDGAPSECTPGNCLVCIAQPNGPLELDI